MKILQTMLIFFIGLLIGGILYEDMAFDGMQKEISKKAIIPKDGNLKLETKFCFQNSELKKITLGKCYE